MALKLLNGAVEDLEMRLKSPRCSDPCNLNVFKCRNIAHGTFWVDKMCHRTPVRYVTVLALLFTILSSPQDAPVKLCDFGFAKIDQGDLMTPQFTPYYVAPQVRDKHICFSMALRFCKRRNTGIQCIFNPVFFLRYLRLKEDTRKKSLGLYLPHPLLIPITRWTKHSGLRQPSFHQEQPLLSVYLIQFQSFDTNVSVLSSRAVTCGLSAWSSTSCCAAIPRSTPSTTVAPSRRTWGRRLWWAALSSLKMSGVRSLRWRRILYASKCLSFFFLLVCFSILLILQ